MAPSLSRKESQEQTRTRLLQTAKELFLADGYNATSLSQVADAAGYTKGAVYSNFATKQELGLAVLDLVVEDRAAALLSRLGPATTIDELLAGFAVWAESFIGDVGWTALEVEFATSTRALSDITAALAERRRTVTALLAGLLAERADALGFTLRAPVEDAAVHILALGIGLGVQRAFDPELPVTVLVDYLGWLTGRG